MSFLKERLGLHHDCKIAIAFTSALTNKKTVNVLYDQQTSSRTCQKSRLENWSRPFWCLFHILVLYDVLFFEILPAGSRHSKILPTNIASACCVVLCTKC